MKRFTLSRRAFLGGAGVVVGLPVLESLARVERAARAGTPAAPKRLVFFYVPNGLSGVPGSFWPTTEGTAWETTPMLAPLASTTIQVNGSARTFDLKGDVIVVGGLHNAVAAQPGFAAQSKHEMADPSLLTAVPTLNESTPSRSVGISVDQLAAKTLGQYTPGLPYLAVGTAVGGWYSDEIIWSSPTSSVKQILDPGAAFDAVFGGFDPNATQADVQRRIALRASVLDYVQSDVAGLAPKLSKGDRARLDEYLTSVRALEARIKGTSTQACASGARPAGFADIREHTQQMLDVVAHALACDRTRVVTFLYEHSGSEIRYDFLGNPYGHWHDGVVHDGDGLTTVDKHAAFVKGMQLQVSQLAYLMAKLKATPDVDGRTVLDNTAIMFLSEFGVGDGHWLNNVPVIIGGGGGGKFKPGRYVRVGANVDDLYGGGPPLANAYLAMLDSVGITVPSFGNSTGMLNLS